MQPSVLFILLLAIVSVAYHIGRKRALFLAGGKKGSRVLHSRPVYYGALAALRCGVPALVLFFSWLAVEDAVIIRLVSETLPPELKNLPPDRFGLVVNDIKNIVEGSIFSQNAPENLQEAASRYRELLSVSHIALTICTVSATAIAIFLFGRKITPQLKARNQVELFVKSLLIVCSTIAIFTTIGIVLSVLYESLLFFKTVSVIDFLTGLEWSPQTAIRSDQVGSSGAFGAIPVFMGTLLISAIAMVVAVPIGLMSAIYMSEYADRRVRAVVKPIMEILAGIPTVVYGFFAALTVAPFVRDFGTMLGLEVSSENALAAGVVMGVMIIPFVSSISDDVIRAVPQALRDGAYGLGATRSETIKQVVIPAALPGIVGGVLLAVSRAIGETMIVVMAAGLAANLTANPFKAVTTVTVQIVTLLVGDQEFDSPKTLAAFALGLFLFIATLLLNVLALYVVRKYREQYE